MFPASLIPQPRTLSGDVPSGLAGTGVPDPAWTLLNEAPAHADEDVVDIGVVPDSLPFGDVFNLVATAQVSALDARLNSDTRIDITTESESVVAFTRRLESERSSDVRESGFDASSTRASQAGSDRSESQHVPVLAEVTPPAVASPPHSNPDQPEQRPDTRALENVSIPQTDPGVEDQEPVESGADESAPEPDLPASRDERTSSSFRPSRVATATKVSSSPAERTHVSHQRQLHDVESGQHFEQATHSSTPPDTNPSPTNPAIDGSMADASTRGVPASVPAQPTGESVEANRLVGEMHLLEQIQRTLASQKAEFLAEEPTHIEIQLDPPELGRIWIRVERTDHGLAAQLSVQDASVRAALETHVDDLRQALTESNLSFAGFELADHRQPFEETVIPVPNPLADRHPKQPAETSNDEAGRWDGRINLLV